MDLFFRLLVRAAIWIRRPPSKQHVYAIIAAAVLALAVAGLEALDLWPDWARTEGHPRTFRR